MAGPAHASTHPMAGVPPALARSGVLDSPDFFERWDPSGMRRRLRLLPESCRWGWEQGSRFTPPPDWGELRRVVVGGMGGSAVAGDLLADLASSDGSLSISVVRDFSLPFPLDDATLFLACSHSGATRETLSLYRQAREGGTPLLAMAGGGPLSDLAVSDGIPLLKVDAPGEPRSALGYNVMLLLGALGRRGLFAVADREVDEAIQALEATVSRCGAETPTRDNPAKQLAQELHHRLIVVVGGGILSGMARRWKTQFNENAKALAFFDVLPEALHNSVEAFCDLPAYSGGSSAGGSSAGGSSDSTGADGAGGSPMTLLLRPATGGPDLQLRFDVAAKLLEHNKVPHRVVAAPDGPPLAQMLSMLALGDYVSYYLAMLRGVDPSPTPGIDLGKALLERPNS